MNIEIQGGSSDSDLTLELQLLPKPIGIVVFGPHTFTKCAAYSLIFMELPGTVKDPKRSAFRTVFQNNGNILILMDEDDSCSPVLRKTLFTALKNAGAESLVGVYAKPSLDAASTDTWLSSPESLQRFSNQVRRMEENPPTLEGLERLIIVTK